MITIAYVLTETKANSLIEQKNTLLFFALALDNDDYSAETFNAFAYLLKQNTSLGMSGNSYDAKNLAMTL